MISTALHSSTNPSQMSIRCVRLYLPWIHKSHKFMLITPNHLVLDLFGKFPGLFVPSPSPSLLKTGVRFTFFQSPGTFPACHDSSKTIKSHLTITGSASSLSTHGRNTSGPMCQKRTQTLSFLLRKHKFRKASSGKNCS